MSTVKIKTNDSKVFGQKVILPGAGTVEVSTEGVVEISEEHAEAIINGNVGWELEADSSANNKAEEGEPVTQEELEALSLEELIQMAASAKIKKAEYVKIIKDKDEMVKFLLEKLN